VTSQCVFREGSGLKALPDLLVGWDSDALFQERISRVLTGLDPWKYVAGVRVCYDPLKCHIFRSKLLLDNSASFTSSMMKDLCQKWKVKLIFRGAHRLSGTGIVECLEIVDVGCNSRSRLMAWPDWPWPHILRQIYATVPFPIPPSLSCSPRANVSAYVQQQWLNQCWNRVFQSRVAGSMILAGSGRVRGQCDTPGVWPGFCSFCPRFIVAFGKRISHLGIWDCSVVLNWHFVLTFQYLINFKIMLEIFVISMCAA